MTVLDTNVLSEVLRPTPEPKVLEWLDELPMSSVFTTAISRGEILYGIRVMPDGQRRDHTLIRGQTGYSQREGLR